MNNSRPESAGNRRPPFAGGRVTSTTPTCLWRLDSDDGTIVVFAKSPDRDRNRLCVYGGESRDRNAVAMPIVPSRARSATGILQRRLSVQFSKALPTSRVAFRWTYCPTRSIWRFRMRIRSPSAMEIRLAKAISVSAQVVSWSRRSKRRQRPDPVGQTRIDVRHSGPESKAF